MKTTRQAHIFGLLGGSIFILILVAFGVFNKPQVTPPEITQYQNLNVNLYTLKINYEKGRHKQLTDAQVAAGSISYYPKSCPGWIYFTPFNDATMACYQSVNWHIEESTCHFPDSEICPNHKLAQIQPEKILINNVEYTFSEVTPEMIKESIIEEKDFPPAEGFKLSVTNMLFNAESKEVSDHILDIYQKAFPNRNAAGFHFIRASSMENNLYRQHFSEVSILYQLKN